MSTIFALPVTAPFGNNSAVEMFASKPHRSKRNVDDTMNFLESTPKNEEGKYECNNCKKSYQHLKHLKRHYMKHTGYRPHVCTLCQDTFCRSDILKRHRKRCLEKLLKTGQCSQSSRVPKRLQLLTEKSRFNPSFVTRQLPLESDRIQVIDEDQEDVRIKNEELSETISSESKNKFLGYYGQFKLDPNKPIDVSLDSSYESNTDTAGAMDPQPSILQQQMFLYSNTEEIPQLSSQQEEDQIIMQSQIIPDETGYQQVDYQLAAANMWSEYGGLQNGSCLPESPISTTESQCFESPVSTLSLSPPMVSNQYGFSPDMMPPTNSYEVCNYGEPEYMFYLGVGQKMPNNFSQPRLVPRVMVYPRLDFLTNIQC